MGCEVTSGASSNQSTQGSPLQASPLCDHGPSWLTPQDPEARRRSPFSLQPSLARKPCDARNQFSRKWMLQSTGKYDQKGNTPLKVWPGFSETLTPITTQLTGISNHQNSTHSSWTGLCDRSHLPVPRELCDIDMDIDCRLLPLLLFFIFFEAQAHCYRLKYGKYCWDLIVHHLKRTAR